MALSAPLKSVLGKHTIFSQNLVHTAFRPIGKTPLQTENITVTACIQYPHDNVSAYLDVVLEELRHLKSLSYNTKSLKNFAFNKKQILMDHKQDFVFSLSAGGEHKVAQIKLLEPQQSNKEVSKPENIILVDIKQLQNNSKIMNLTQFISFIREELNQDRVSEILQILITKLDVARRDDDQFSSMIKSIRESKNAEMLFPFLGSPSDLHTRVNIKADLLGLENLIIDSADYGKLQVTTTSNSQGINFTFEVLCMKPNTIMTLYRYKPLPIVINKNVTNDVQAALYIESQEANVIAIGQDNTTFMVLNQDELHCSIEFNGVKVCKGFTKIRKTSTDSCLGALFEQDNEQIKRHCKFQVRKLSLDAVDLGNNTYNIISPERSNISFQCSNKPDNSFEIPSQQYFTMSIKPKCWTHFLDKFISATPYIVTSWNSSFLSTIAEPLIKDFNSENQNKKEPNYLTIVLSIIGVVVVISFLSLAVCCLKKEMFLC